MASSIPYIHLLVLDLKYANALDNALDKYGIKNLVSYSVHEAYLSQLHDSVKFDLIVSPANSYGILDGGFDGAISRAFSPKNNFYALTRHCQRVIYDQYRGFQPPGTCHLIELPAEFDGEKVSTNVWGTRFIGHCPTMRLPSDCRWDREVVYECMWSLFNQIYNHNQLVAAADVNKSIRSILMTPLATGTGLVSIEKWAHQVALAIKHFSSAVEQPTKYSAMQWSEVHGMSQEVESTNNM